MRSASCTFPPILPTLEQQGLRSLLRRDLPGPPRPAQRIVRPPSDCETLREQMRKSNLPQGRHMRDLYKGSDFNRHLEHFPTALGMDSLDRIVQTSHEPSALETTPLTGKLRAVPCNKAQSIDYVHSSDPSIQSDQGADYVSSGEETDNGDQGKGRRNRRKGRAKGSKAHAKAEQT